MFPFLRNKKKGIDFNIFLLQSFDAFNFELEGFINVKFIMYNYNKRLVTYFNFSLLLLI